jgi:hypothetical protein
MTRLEDARWHPAQGIIAMQQPAMIESNRLGIFAKGAPTARFWQRHIICFESYR